MVAKLFSSPSWEFFYLKLKLFGSTSIAGGLLADTNKNAENRTVTASYNYT